MSKVKPPTFGEAPRIQVMNPLGEVLCDFFLQALILFGYMRAYSDYEVLVQDYFAVEVQCQFDGGYIIRVSLAENPQEIALEVLEPRHKASPTDYKLGRVLDSSHQKIGATIRIRLSTLYAKSATSVARIFYQRLAVYLP